jgi:uncharacterized protein YfaS (alpha-2-macroglobulin family)
MKRYLPLLFIITIVVLCFQSCNEQQKKPAGAIDNPFISAYTSGVISIEAPIRIRLAQEHEKFEQNSIIEKKLFDFSPSIDGDAYWIAPTTIEFRAKENLKSDQVYQVTFHVSNLIEEAKGDNKTFKFSISTIKPSFITNIDDLRLQDDEVADVYVLIGQVSAADYVDDAKIEEVLNASFEGNNLKIDWEHFQAEKKHQFSIKDITPTDHPSQIILQWDGKPIDYDYKNVDTVKVAAKGVFEILGIKTNTKEHYILCTFSEPLNTRQKFESYVQLDASTQPRFNASSNKLYIYLSDTENNTVTITLQAGLRSKTNKKLEEDYQQTVVFEDPKPAIRFTGKGVLMPSSSNLTIPFQAVNLSAVDVRIYRIYENNILQFLQVNNLDGSGELRRVGKPISTTTVKLGEGKKVDLHRWNAFSLDLANSINPEPGAIYEVHLSFKRAYSLYECDNGASRTDRDDNMSKNTSSDDESDDDDNYYYYDWSERNNPCHDAYYNYTRFISRNVIATDIGMIVKQGGEKSLLVFVNNLITTQPLNGVKITAYDYQQQPIGEGRTDNEGKVTLTYTERPYILMASQDNHKSYIRIDEGLSLSLSSFDVSGVEIKKGINGFLYGERDIWRPGDTIFLSFMLQDIDRTLPAHHPVVFELYDVHNQLINRIVHTHGENGLYAFPSATNPDAPTGTWEAKVRVGGVTFYKSVRVATIKPNRLKIVTTLDQDIITQNKNITGELSARWLHGANAPGLKADITARFTPVRTTFKNFSDYSFEDITKQSESPSERVESGRLNENGCMKFSIPTKNNDDAPGTLRASLGIRVFEEGGEFSIDNASVNILPYSSYVGLKVPKGEGYYDRLEADKDHAFTIITVDDSGKAISRNVEVSIYQTEWSWWWSSSDNSIANYTHRLYKNKVYSTKVTTDNSGKGSFKFRVNHPEWGIYLVQVVDPKSGHRVTQRIYIDWWYYGRGNNQAEGANMLTFTTDKEKYNVGENALITIPSTAGARALVSIETGSKVLRFFWVECKDQKTDITIPATADMTPNVYVHITMIQPHAQTKNDLPIRLYGAIPMLVEDPQTRLYPEIKGPNVIRPEESFNIKVSEKNGKEMSYTLAIVDDGLLDLTHFITPDPWSFFFKRQALGVRSWDLYNFVMGAYGGKIEQIFAIGGDDEMGQQDDTKKANRFKPVVKFAGPFTLKAGKSKDHKFTINNYVGSVRAMVIAGTGQAYGKADNTMPVRSPLMVQATLPRVLGPGETVSLPVTVFAMEKHVKNVKIEIKPNSIFEVIGGTSKNISFKETGDEIVTFQLRVKNTLGYGNVKISASSGNEKAEQSIELDVRTSNPAVIVSEEAIIQGNKSETLSLKLPGIEGTNTAEVEVSSLPPLNLGERLNYLITYPHGCLEQTTSSAFPQLYLGDILDLNEKLKTQTENNIKSAINRLKYFVTTYGTFSYWPGCIDHICDWTNNYAGHFMLEAERKGYKIPGGMKENWINAQQKAARNWSPENNDRYQVSQSDLTQAYRLYVLALANAPELGAMNRLKERTSISTQTKWMLAGAYLLAGQPETAKAIIKNLPMEIKPYSRFSETYGSSYRDEAMILEILTRLGDKENSFLLAKRVSDILNSATWMDTQTTAYCLMNLAKYAIGSKGNLEFSYTPKGKKVEKITSKKTIWNNDLGSLSGTETSMKIDNNTSHTIFVRFTAKGYPLVGEEKAAENNLRISVRYYDTNGNPIHVDNLSQGTDFEAEVKITNPGLRGRYSNMALTQIFPSGWEILENRLTDEQKNTGITYMDIRDDRVLAYFDIPASNTITVKVKLNAAYVGRYYLPAVACEAMYDHSINANSVGRWITVE